MANFNLKNIPDDLYAQLKESASTNHRSINSELIACLEKIFMPQRYSAEEHLAKARALRRQIKVKNIPVEDITEAKHFGRP